MANRWDEKRFRGNWAPDVKVPVQRFLPTPPPPKPKEQDAAPPPPAPAPPRSERAPPAAKAPGAVNIRDRNNDYRAYIAPDGECVNNAGQVLGFINKDSGECGSADEEFLGAVEEQVGTNTLVVKDNLGATVGTVDQGRALVHDGDGKIVAEVQNSGEVYGHAGTYLGCFEGFTFREMRTIALYLLLIDPGMLSETEG